MAPSITLGSSLTASLQDCWLPVTSAGLEVPHIEDHLGRLVGDGTVVGLGFEALVGRVEVDILLRGEVHKVGGAG